jgi:NTP pyrophosphatase (non-canonical NTP hydrolase)
MKFNSLKEFFEDIHQNAKSHGFWEGEMTPDAILAKIALCHGELSEALEEVRKGEGCYNMYFKGDKPEGLIVELADAVIRIVDLCEGLGLDLETAMMVKHKYNKGREWKHGKKI